MESLLQAYSVVSSSVSRFPTQWYFSHPDILLFMISRSDHHMYMIKIEFIWRESHVYEIRLVYSHEFLSDFLKV